MRKLPSTAELLISLACCLVPFAGDLARWRLDGTIEYLGRMDQQVSEHVTHS